MAFETRGNWPNPLDAPAEEDLARCVHCGLCANACPTHVITGLEAESPRGRIYLARSVSEGRVELSAAVQGHWDLCLQCRACEAVCPSGVPYGRIIERVRAQVAEAPPSGGAARRVRRFVLRQVVARPKVLAAVVAPVRWFAGSPLRPVARRTRMLRLLGPLGRGEAQLPARLERPVRPGDALPGPAEPQSHITLFTGCIMGEVFGSVHRATARVLARCGIAADATAGQGCCGALHAHDGDIEFARTLARRNIDALDGGETIVVNSAGCGAAMKEYGDLLAGDPAYAAKARAFAARVRDLTEVLAEQPALPAKFNGRVAWQDPCHLAHAQRIRNQPRALLDSVRGCEQIQTAGQDLCCGAAGIYSLVEPEMSGQLRARKAEQFAKHRPDVIVTANPGCQMQYEAAVREAGIPARVLHIAEFLDESSE